MNAQRLQILESWLFAGYVGLLVLSMLCTSDAPPGHGLFVVQSLLWTLLAVGTAAWCLLRPLGLQWMLVDSLVLAWMSWTGVTTVAVAGIGDLRSAVNACWQTVAFCLAILIGRRLLLSPVRQQAAGWLMVSLASIAALQGLFQYAVVTPAMRKAIAEHPGVVLADAGIHAAVDSPEAKRFFDRARNSEPLASFTLTNSLAGFLLPGMILIVVSLAKHFAGTGEHSNRMFGMLVFSLSILATCLLLTKSRTGMMAMMLGLLMIGLIWRGWSWKWLSFAAVGFLVLGVLVVMSGGLDWQVLSEAPKSVQYRVEYWRSTTVMIAEYPWLGVGPGNFQSVYTKYMLPQASETIADPHNFLFEIAATTGLPGLLIFIALLVVCFRHSRSTEMIDQPKSESRRDANYMVAGGAIGLLLVPAISQINEIDTNYLFALPIIWWFGFPIFLLTAFSLRSGINLVSRDSIVISLAVLLSNLLAAGGISFPSVALLVALLLALLTVEQVEEIQTAEAKLPRFHTAHYTSWVGVLAAICLVGLCYLTGYKTVLDARRLLREADIATEASLWKEANLSSSAAVLADPWDAEIPLASIPRGNGLNNHLKRNRLIEASKRNPRSSRIFEMSADFEEFVYWKGNHKVELYRKAITYYPTRSTLHAKLAWFCFSFDREQAIREAREALRLDALHSHEDKKLANEKDVPLDFRIPGQREVNLKQLMHYILAEAKKQP